MGAYDDLLADVPAKKSGAYDDLLSEVDKPEPSLKDKIYKAANKLFQPSSVIDEANISTQPTGFDNAGAFERVIQNNQIPNNLQAGSKIVDGLTGIAEVGGRKGYAGLGRIEAGAIKALADVLGSETLSNVAKSQQDYANQIEGGAVLRGKPIEGFAKESIVQDLPGAASNAIGSIITTAPSLAAGAIAPELTFPAMFATTGAQEYGQGRESGLNPAGAVLRAIPNAALEVIGEKVGGSGQLADALHAAAKGNGFASLGSAMVGSAIKELPGEELTTTGQFLVDKVPGIGTNQEAGINDYKQQVKDTALATLLQSGAMAGGGQILNNIADSTQSEPAINESTPEATQNNQFDSAATLDALNQAKELVKPRLEIGSGTQADDALAAQKQAEYDAKTSPATPTYDDLLADVDKGATNEQPITNAAVGNGTAESKSDNVDRGAGTELLAQPAEPSNAAENTQGSTGDISASVADKPNRTLKQKSNTLLTTLRDLGGVSINDKLDVTGEDKGFAPGGYNQIFRKNSRQSLKGHIESGTLDDYLPPAMRLSSQTQDSGAFDSTEAYDYLAERIRNGEKVIHYDTEQEINARKYYQEDGVTAQSDIAEAGDLFNEDEINEQLRIASGAEREAATQAKQFDTGSQNSIVERGAGTQAGNQSAGISQAQADEVTRPEINNEVRPLVESIVKRRAAANQLGKQKQFDTALQLAKDFMNGEKVAPAKFKNAAILFKNDKPLADSFTQLNELSKNPAKQARVENANAVDAYKRIISSATSVKELQHIARDIQDDEALSDVQVQMLDDLVFDAQDKFTEEQNAPDTTTTQGAQQPESNADLLGDNTKNKQAIADAERAKDAKRNSGEDNQNTFTLSGSNSEVDQAEAHGAQDLFTQPQEVEKASKSLTDAGVTGKEKLDTIKDVREGKVTADEVADAYGVTAESPKQNIQDSGEKIFVKKDAWATYNHKVSQSKDLDIKAEPLSKSWPEPDYQKLIDDGMDAWSVAFIRAIRDEIPTKPKKSWKLSKWVETVSLMRNLSYAFMEGGHTKEGIQDIINGGGFRTLAEHLNGRIDLYMAVGHDTSLKDMKVVKGSYNLYEGVEYKPAKVIWSVEGAPDASSWSNWNKTYATGDTRQEAIDNFVSAWKNKPEAAKAEKKVEFGIWSSRLTNEFFIGKKIGKNVAHIKDGFKTAKEARLYMAENQDELVALYEKYKEIPNERRTENNVRVGEDHRNGADVTSTQFDDTFGFRGTVFGNTVEQSRRQQDLNNAYDALMDLAGVIGVPPKALSLNGELGLLFGADGKGGKNAPMAHFSSSKLAINLTKKNGAGSLAHELFHAIDNYFSRKDGKNDFLTESQRAGENVRPEIVQAFRQLMNAINTTSIKERSKNLDKRRTKDYWSTGLEMAARSFESYIINKLQDQGASNDYLANIVSEDAFGLENGYPYPTAAEIPAIRAAFDNFFNVLETKETDNGNVAMFSRNDNNESVGLSVADIEKILAPELDKLKNITDVRVVKHQYKIPQLERALSRYLENPIPDNEKDLIDYNKRPVEGAYQNGSIYIVADSMRSVERAREVLKHEVAHLSIEQMLETAKPGLYKKLTNQITILDKTGNEYIRKIGAIVDESQPDLDNEARAKEILAVIAERNDEVKDFGHAVRNVWQRFMDGIKAFYKLVFNTDLNDQEVRDIVAMSMRYAQGDEVYLSNIVDGEIVESVIKDGEIRFSRRNSEDAKKPIPVDSRDNWLFRRDELGNIQLAPTGKAYDFISNVTQNIANKANFGMASPELRRQIRHFKADMQKALDVAENVAHGMQKMTPEDRALVSDVVENMLKTGTVPPQHVLDVAANMQSIMDTQTDELVKLGMLNKDAAERWRGKYLPRFYNRDQDPALTTLGQKLLRTALPIRGLGGGSLKGRGLYKEINVRELDNWEALGWEVRDTLWKKNRQGKLELVDQNNVRENETVMIWRDYTPAERESMGENRDAMFRFVMGYTAMQNDIALGRLFDGIASNQEWTRSRQSEGYTKVPDSEIAETGGVKKYGNLAGLYVRDDIMQHISQYEQSSDLVKYYKKALSFWKAGKTVLNPVSHMNNMVSNLTMAHFAGVSYWDTHKYIGAIRDFVKDAPMIQEAKDVGLMTGDITRAELIAEMPDDIKAMMNSQDSKITKSAKATYNVLTFGLTKPMSKAYRFEDDFFKYLIYKEARANGVSPDDAVDYATKYIFNYDDLPKTARLVRDAAIPFFAYTYKAVPALAYTVFNYPWRFAAPAAAIYGLNALAYGLIAGDDDDDLAEKFAKGKALEAEERKNLPPWMQGKSALGTEKTIRLGTDEKTGLPIYTDISRFMPGGDMFDIAHGDFTTLPAPITPSNPVLTTIAALIPQINKDMFTGKDIIDKNDTPAEAAKKRASWLIKQISPAIAPTGYHAEKLLNAGALMADTTISIPFIGFGDDVEYTGFGKDGLPVQPKYAAMNVLGVKARPTDLELSAEISQGQDNSEIKSIKAEIRQAARLLDKGAISQRAYDKTEADGMRKIEDIINKQ